MKQYIPFAQLVGTTIKHYRLEQLLQKEQHEAIYLVTFTKNNQNFQMRLINIPEEITAQECSVLLGKVQHAMSRIAALQHPVIQPILAYGHEQGSIYLVTPFIPAHYALASVLAAQGPLDLIQAGYNLELLASALEYAHKQGVIHGNLTASNVFLRPSYGSHPPTLLLTDIGIAHLRALLKPSKGPLHYTAHSPKQPIDYMSDLSGLGALLYQMLTAHDPITVGLQDPKTQRDRANSHLQILPLNTWRQDLPTELDAVINKALTSNTNNGQSRRHRDSLSAPYQSLNALVDAYYDIVTPATHAHPVKQLSETPTVERKLVSLSSQHDRPSTRRKFSVVLAATGVVVLAAGGGWLFMQAQQRSQTTQETTTPVATSGAQTATPSPPPAHNGTVIAYTADLPINHASPFTIRHNQSTKPGVLIHLEDNRFVAFDPTCTHEGCRVSYSTQSHYLECPCHGAIFDPAEDAAVLAGPAPTPLTSIIIHINADGTITI